MKVGLAARERTENCVEPECDRPAAEGGRCVLHASRLGPLPGPLAVPAQQSFAAEPEAPDERAALREEEWRRKAREAATLLGVLWALMALEALVIALAGADMTSLVMLLGGGAGLFLASRLTPLAREARLLARTRKQALSSWAITVGYVPPLIASLFSAAAGAFGLAVGHLFRSRALFVE